MDDQRRSGGLASFFRKLWQRVWYCPRGKHRRDLRQVRASGETYVSRCVGCSVPMIRKSKRNWIVDTRGA